MVLLKNSGLSVIFSVNSLYLIWVHIGSTSTVPVSVSRLESLCAGSRPSNTNPLVLTGDHLNPEDDTIIANRLWVHAREIEMQAVSLRDRYAAERIQSTRLLETLDNSTLAEFPSLHVLNQQTEFMSHLLADYGRVSAAITFIEQVREDEQNSLFSPNYFNEIQVLELKMYSFFCHLFYAIHERTNGTVHAVQQPTVQAAATNAERYKRDYKIIKDVVLLFRAISIDYDIRRLAGSIQLLLNSSVAETKRVPTSNKST